MFICSECKKEYSLKPQYCDDCGNDVFEEIKETAIEQENNNTETKEDTATQYKSDNTQEKSFDEPKNSRPFKVDFKELLSYIIFLVCLLLSFIVLFAINPDTNANNENSEKIADKKEVKNIENIPSLDSFWNNEPPKQQISTKTEPAAEIKTATVSAVESKQEAQPAVVKVPLKYIPKTENNPVVKNSSSKKTVANTTTPLKSKIQINNVKTPSTPQKVSTSTTPKTTQNTAQKPAQKTTQSVSQKPSATQQTQQSKQPLQVQQPSQQPQQTKPTSQPQQTTQTKQVQTVDNTQLKKELSSYKSSLRNTIGKKIDFADVVGDGSCTVSFKIDSSGKLVNRAFSKQSTNSTLNDAVYKAVMQTPAYNPPPSGYKGETLYLKISFYNGNFEISLI